MPYVVAGGIAVALKFAIIIGATVLLAGWNPARRLFGFAPLPSGGSGNGDGGRAGSNYDGDHGSSSHSGNGDSARTA